MMKILLKIRFFSVKNIAYSLWRNSPTAFFITVGIVCLGLGVTYFILWKGLHFIIGLGGLGTIIVKKIVFILFFMLFIMVAGSFGLLFYSMGLKSKETEYLLTLPFLRKKLLITKFVDSSILAAWIPLWGLSLFFFAYVEVGRLPHGLFLFYPIYLLPFLIISCFTGYIITLFLLRFFTIKRIFVVSTIIFLFVIMVYRKLTPAHQEGGLLYLLSEEVLFLNAAKLWFLPFSWPGHGLGALEDGYRLKASLYFLNLWTLACFLGCIIGSFEKTFMYIYHAFFSSSAIKHVGRDYCEIIVSKFKIVPRYMRYLLIKDIKLFTRDVGLWSQFLIFFGILLFYFLNLRRFSYHELGVIWKNLLIFLNAFSLLLIISSLSIRFVFPQWSLEGRNFWLIKLAPVSLRKIFFEKFVFAFGILFVISEILVFISSKMLNTEQLFFNILLVVIPVSVFTMVSFALGLGAYFANFKQEYYLNAVESVGGLVTLICNLAYTFITIFLFAATAHLYYIGKIMYLQKTLITMLVIWFLSSLILSLFINCIGLRRLIAKEY